MKNYRFDQKLHYGKARRTKDKSIKNSARPYRMEGLSLQDIVGNTLYVTVAYDENIVLVGKLEAIDAQGNLLLNFVKEQSNKKNKYTHQRTLGIVSVPRDTIVSVRMEQSVLTRRQALKQDLLSKVI